MPNKKAPTIYDVAKRAGVSITTVSRMLNDPDRVNGVTRERVMAAVDALGFMPKAEARARALRRTGRIGVISPFFTAPSFVQRLRGISEALSAKKFELVIYTVDSANHLKSFLSSLPLTGNWMVSSFFLCWWMMPMSAVLWNIAANRVGRVPTSKPKQRSN
jgi:LacI family transcriptional regulator